MAAGLTGYLNTVRASLRLDLNFEADVLRELSGHIDDRVKEFKESGLSEEAAARRCLELLGSAKLFARQIYEAYGRASWRQTLLASLPHFLFGIMFALDWWRQVGGLLCLLVLVVSAVVYAWCQVKPRWLSSWLSYALLPVVAAGLFLLWLPRGWAWLATPVYVLLGLWLLYRFTARIKYRDWLYASLMLLPMPTIIGWFLVAQPSGSFPGYSSARVETMAPWIGFSFIAMAVAVAVFMRLRRRWLKGAVLVVTGLLSLLLVAYYAGGRLDLGVYLALNLLMLGLFLTPALMEKRRGADRHREPV
ncbi:MAG: permease prefix domain 1-containing protein [Chloroflexota bacterium]